MTGRETIYERSGREPDAAARTPGSVLAGLGIVATTSGAFWAGLAVVLLHYV